MNLVEILRATALRHPDRPAVTDVRYGVTITYAELAREADTVSAFLRAHGVEPGQRIGLIGRNDAAHVAAVFGLLATGACVVPLAPTLAPREIAEIVREIDVNGCLSCAGIEAVPRPDPDDVVSGGVWQGFTFHWIDQAVEGPVELADLRPAFIRFTSGTTARAKGVVLSHEATAARVAAADAVLCLVPEDRILWVLPLAYHFAVTIVAYVRAGAHILMCPDTLPGTVAAAIREFRATVFYASPLHFERIGNLTSGVRLTSLRLALSTSASITPAAITRFEAVWGVPVGQAYGLIEAGLPCINTRADGLPATSVGRPVPGYEVAAFADGGTRLPTGRTGEIGVRGAGLFSAYYAPWRRRADVLRDGWFLTGDIGRVDEAGALHLTGRKKAIIVVAGLKFFPEEVEECIAAFPGVKECRVVGAPHPRLGQVPRAEVVLETPGVHLEALRAHCARALSSYKVPIEFRVVPAIARTPGGKILRRPLTDVPVGE